MCVGRIANPTYMWSHEVVLERLVWVGVALLVTAVAAIPFDRFDPARRTLKKQRGRTCTIPIKSSSLRRWRGRASLGRHGWRGTGETDGSQYALFRAVREKK
ncbi:MAG: hypothetical protein HF973_18595 [Chloroflexi bacterium]|nr:hypothetical protein [Chloroflexota bacterium]